MAKISEELKYEIKLQWMLNLKKENPIADRLQRVFGNWLAQEQDLRIPSLPILYKIKNFYLVQLNDINMQTIEDNMFFLVGDKWHITFLFCDRCREGFFIEQKKIGHSTCNCKTIPLMNIVYGTLKFIYNLIYEKRIYVVGVYGRYYK